MILLTKGQPLYDNPGMVVYDATGYYEDGTSVVCASATAPEEPLVRYEAKFVAYGGMVYTITDPEQLMAEVVKIDPQSLFGKTNEQVAVDNLVEKIQTIESPEVPSTETTPTPTETENIPTTPETPVTPEVVPEPVIETPTPVVEPTVNPIPEPITELPPIEPTTSTPASIVETIPDTTITQ